jgi:DNA replication protein DnaC
LKNLQEILPKETREKYLKLRGEFEAEHPELFVEDRHLTSEQRREIFQKRAPLWRLKVGVNEPLVPSSGDHTREAGCLRCRDEGWLQPFRPTEDGLRTYAERLVQCPDCGGQDRQSRLLAYAGIPDAQRLATFESFKVNKGNKPAYDSARALVTGSPFFMLLIYGTYGNGKTHLAYAACHAAAKMGTKAKFMYVPSFMSKLRGMMDSGGGLDAEIQTLKDTPFLALDDFGAELGTPWQQSVIEEIINHRYANCGYTIVTTNKDLTTIPGPLLSRFQDKQLCRIVFNEAPDYRPRKKVPA